MKKLKTIFIAGVSVLTMSSCSFFDAEPDNFVTSGDPTKGIIEAQYMGLIGLVQDVADDLIFLTELRGDLLMPTQQAPEKFWDVYNYTAGSQNELVDPARYYRIVSNSNDFLRRMVEYNKNYPGVMSSNEYKQLVASAICFRTWAYLTIGKLYGGAVYYDYSMSNEEDLSKLPYLDFDQLVNELIYFMTSGVDNVTGVVRVNLDEIFGHEGLEWRRMSISPDMLLTELYLWAGNYQDAAKRGINLITGKGVIEAGTGEDQYRFTLKFNAGDFYWGDIYRANQARDHVNEGITMVMYDATKSQTHDLQTYFSAKGSNLYYMRPNERYLALFDYKNKLSTTYAGMTDVQKAENIMADANNTQRISTVLGEEMNQAVVNKFHRTKEWNARDQFLFLYRAGELHLMIAEALTATGRFDAADSLLNYGAAKSWSGTGVTYNYPFNSPVWAHDKFKSNPGIRGRVGEPRIKAVDYLSSELKAVAALPDGDRPSHPLYDKYYARMQHVLDSMIADETGRELGYEGKRWFTLLRLARNNNDPDILAVPVSKKFNAEQQPAMLRYLRNENNWFLPDGYKK